ncbi:MAG: adenosine kinase [Mariprofundales bacterium]|nr:adenosine kinase [Mariprofundales bacterium]
MQYNVLGIGNAIMDIQVQCDDAFLQDQGIDKGIMTLVEEVRQREVLTALSGHQWHYCSGGSAANTVVGVAEMGGATGYTCLTGNDQHGEMYLTEMHQLGIHINTEASSGTTGTCVVLVTPDAQRTMLTHLGISANLCSHHLNASDIACTEYLYIEGYLFAADETRQAALEAIKIAATQGVKVALTLSDPFLINICRESFTKLMDDGAINLLFCNQEEAIALTGKQDPRTAISNLNQQVPHVALTLGASGSLIADQGDLIEIPGVEAKAIDTTGAGDMYAAGVLYGITHQRSWAEAGALGSRAAARIVAQFGARLGSEAAVGLV